MHRQRISQSGNATAPTCTSWRSFTSMADVTTALQRESLGEKPVARGNTAEHPWEDIGPWEVWSGAQALQRRIIPASWGRVCTR